MTIALVVVALCLAAAVLIAAALWPLAGDDERAYIEHLEHLVSKQSADLTLPVLAGVVVRRPKIYRELTPAALQAAADERMANTSDRLPVVVDSRPVYAFVPHSFDDSELTEPMWAVTA